MPNNPITVDEALDRLAAAASNGNRAKRRLAAELATMTPEQLRKVKPEAFARLGLAGLQLFAVASKSMRTVEPRPTKTARPAKQDGPLVRARRWWHFAHPLTKCLLVMTVCGGVGGAAAHLGGTAVDYFESHQTEVIGGWPVCRRLDPAADRCVYRALSNTLTIDRIVGMTGIPGDVIVAWNRHLDFRYALPRGSLVVIPPRRHNP